MSMPDSNSAGTLKPVSVFYAYSHKDEALRDELETHLSILKRKGIISSWHDRRIPSGKDWGSEIDQRINKADIILLLVSADFIASDYCYDKEMKRAMERHELGEARVVPVILRPCDFDGAPFYKLQGLPKDMKPVTRWIDQDEAFTNIAVGIRRSIEELQRLKTERSENRGIRTEETPPRVHEHKSPRRDPYSLQQWGPRLEIEVGFPILPGINSTLQGSTQFCRMPALIDTGAAKTVITPQAVSRIGLPRVDVTRIARAGGINEDVSVYAASIGFPRYRLTRIDAMELICCDLPFQPVQCLLGRDVLRRWRFTFDGTVGEWMIEDGNIRVTRKH